MTQGVGGGPAAKVRGTVKDGAKVISVQLYARPAVKKAIVLAARAAKMSMSQFVLFQTLTGIARESKLAVDELIPDADYEELLRKGSKKRKARVRSAH